MVFFGPKGRFFLGRNLRTFLKGEGLERGFFEQRKTGEKFWWEILFFLGEFFLGATDPICQGILILLVEGEGWGSFLGITFFGWGVGETPVWFTYLTSWGYGRSYSCLCINSCCYTGGNRRRPILVLGRGNTEKFWSRLFNRLVGVFGEWETNWKAWVCDFSFWQWIPKKSFFLGGTRVFSGGKGRREEWGFDSEFIGPNF